MPRIFDDLLEDLRKTQYLQPDQLIERQRSALEPLVRHARDHVPFYRDTGRLDPLFRRDGAIEWDHWGDIPPLTRNDVQRAGDALRAEFLPPQHGKCTAMRTSGSTGEPVTVWHSELSNPVVRAATVIRNLERQGIDRSERLAMICAFKPEEFDLRHARRHPGGYDVYSEAGMIGERYDLSETRPIAELIDEIVAIRPAFLRAHPIVLELLCAYDREHRLPRSGIAAALAVGEHFPAAVKQEVAHHIGCWIVEMYGSVECGRMANSCPDCGRFHVEAETVVIEVVLDDGSAAPVGDTGWVIATPLYNFAMPLIRYDHADRAVVGRPDACSITLPALDAIFGKERTTFTFRNGKIVRPTVSASSIVEYLGAQSFQVAQVADDRCEFRIVPGRIAPSDMRVEEMSKLIRSMWWSDLQIDYKIVNELPRKSRGKLATFVVELPSEGRTANRPRVRSGQG
jgi:phenylacetate-CoA ligase